MLVIATTLHGRTSSPGRSQFDNTSAGKGLRLLEITIVGTPLHGDHVAEAPFETDAGKEIDVIGGRWDRRPQECLVAAFYCL